MIHLDLQPIQTVYDHSPVPFCVIRMIPGNGTAAQDYVFEYVNDALAQLMDRAPASLLRRSARAVFGESDPHRLAIYQETAFEGKNNLFAQYRPEIKKHIRVQCYQLARGYCGCLLSDITEQKETEEALRISEEKFRIATQNSDISFWVYDFDTRQILNTPSFKKTHRKESVVDNVPQSLVECGYVRSDSVNAFVDMYRKLREGAPTASGDFWFRKQDDSGWWCERIVYTNVLDETGKPLRAYALGKDVTTEIQQQVERKKLDIALANSNLYVWEYDVAGKRCIQQPNAMKDLGMPRVMENAPESVIASGLIHPQSIESYRALHEAVRKGAKTASAEICYVNAAGSPAWKRCTYTTIFVDGTPVSAIGCSVNINSIKEMERKFQEEVAYSQALQNENLLVKVRSNITQNVVESYIAQDAVGISADNTPYAIGVEQLAATGFTAEERDMIRHYLNRDRMLRAFAAGDTSYTIDYRRKARNGRIIWAKTTVKSYQNPETGDVMSFMYTYDVSEEKIKDSIITAVTSLEYDFIAYIDLKRNYFRTYLGREDRVLLPPLSSDNYVETMQQINRRAIVPEEAEQAIADMMPNVMKANLEKHRVFSAVYTARDSDGGIAHKRIQYAYLNEEAEQLILTRTDVTDVLEAQKRQQNTLEAALLAAEQANSAKSEFLSRMSHDMRTPMNGILGLLNLTLTLPDLPAEAKDNLSGMNSSANYLLSLINDTLDMSKIESNKIVLHYETVYTADLVKNIVSYVSQSAADNDVALSVTSKNAELEYIRTDPLRLEQIFVNIISNAIKFTPRGGRVDMTIECMKRENGVAYDRISVKDTGIGISKEFLPKVFDPFEQENTAGAGQTAGTGLGMSIVKKLVEMMGGRIEVVSEKGAGTEVIIWINFERVYPQEDARFSAANAQEVQLQGKRILLVEDHPLNASIATKLLERQGVLVECAENGQLAVEKFSAAPVGYYDGILMDIRMPVMDGLTAAKTIRSAHRKDALTVPIIAMTANAFDEDVEKSKAAGMNAHLAKPIEPGRMYEAIAACIQAAAAQYPKDSTL